MIESIVQDGIGINEKGIEASDACLVKDSFLNTDCSNRLNKAAIFE